MLARLRAAAGGDADLAAAAYETAVLRRHALAKHPAGDRMWWTREALEQSTAAPVAAHRTARYAAAGPVLDVCCSAGADLLALAAAGHPVVGVDLDPLRLALARANAAALGLDVTLVRADATALAPRPGAWVFCDPARRSGDRRVFDPRRYAPPLDVVTGWDVAGLGVKTAPGIPHEAVPEGFALEVVSLGGDVKEAVLWAGGCHPGVPRRASVLRTGPAGTEVAVLDAAGAGPAPVRAPGEWLLDPDGAVVRAGLVAELAERLGAWQVDGRIAYLSGDVRPDTPFGRAYRVLEVLPFGLKPLRQVLRRLDAGEVVVLKRGSAVDVDELRRRLRTTGSRRVAVVLTRVDDRPTALVCELVPA